MLRWLALLPLVLACTNDKAVKSPPRLFDDAETKAMATEVLARIAQNASRHCPAPKRIGPATPGPSGPDLVTLVEGTGDVAACMTRLASFAASDLRADLEAKKPELLAFDQACGGFETAIHRASAHEDGCSPYQLGVRVEPNWLPLIRVARVTAFHAQLMADKDPETAIAVLLDALRVQQDLERGHVTLIAAMIAVATSEILGARLDAILDTATLSQPQLTEIDEALVRLIAAYPSFNDLLEGERESQELYIGLGGFMGADWTPPGGWNDLKPPKADPAAKHIADPRDESAAMLAALELAAAARDKACPAGATLRDCRIGLEHVRDGVKPPGQMDLGALWKEGQTDVPAMRAKIRKQVIDILASVSQPPFGTYVTKYASTLKRLAELRLHVAVLRTHACPPTFVAPAALGEPLEIVPDQRTLTVAGSTIHCR